MWQRYFKRIRPGLLARLSNIIVVQIVIIFAALALIIFFPQHEVQFDIGSIQNKLHALTARIVSTVKPAEGSVIEIIREEQTRASLNHIFASVESIVGATVYLPAEDGRFSEVAAYSRDGEEKQGSRISWDMLTVTDQGQFLSESDWPVGSLVPMYFGSGYTVYHYRFDIADNTPALLVSAIDHGLLISSKSNLRYALILLFLSSTLISLLVVYLLSIKFRAPIERLLHGLEKTTEGELYYMIEADGDSEVNRVVESFNKMSRTLWENQQKLKQYNTELKDAYQVQAESRTFLATLVDNSPCCILATSPGDEIVVINRMATEVFGYESGEAINTDIQELFTQPLDTARRDKSPGGHEHGREVVCRKKDGSLFPAYLVVSPVKTESGEPQVHLFILLDISESKGFQEMMVRLDRYYTRGEMAGDIAHEINNYLAVLSGNIELMPLFMKKGQYEKIDKKLELMKNSIERIVRFTDGLMDINQGDPDFQQTDVNQLIQNIVAFIKPQNRFDGIQIVTDLSTELPLAEVDVGLIQQVLINLIHNSSDALSENTDKKQILISSKLVEEETNKSICIEISDNGPGVPSEREESLFRERFTTKRKGHGYGLVTCRKIIDVHNGRIGFISSHGSLFYFEIPTHHVAVSSEAASPTTQGSPAT
ncbi:MAG: ATP-binding protein [candidate division Zixibacteria bacterium]|nr:ATP-binding protein [candidate division Zixibacteria bacterium]